MVNNYYNRIVDLIPGQKARSDTRDTEFGGVELGFDKLPSDATALQRGAAVYSGDTTGSGNAYAASRPDVQLSNTDGDEVTFKVDRANTGAVTLDVDTIGALPLVRPDGTALTANALLPGIIYRATFDVDTPRWQLFSALDTTSGITSLDALTDVTITSAASFQTLFFNGSQWVNSSQLQVTGDGATLGGVTIGITGIGIRSRFTNAGESGGSTHVSISFTDDDASVGFGEIEWRSTGGGTDGDTMYLRNRRHGGNIELEGEDVSGNLRRAFTFDPDVETRLYHGPSNAIRISTTTDGSDTFGTELDLINSGSGTARFNARNSANGVTLQVLVTSGSAQVVQTTNAGVVEDVWIDMTRDGAVGMNHNNVAMTRTALAATGGFEVNNTVTGGGFERVLTLSDLGGGTEQLVDPTGDIRLVALNSGFVGLRSDDSTDVGFRVLKFAHQDGTSRGEIGHVGSSDFQMLSRIHGAVVRLRGEDSGGFIREFLISDPDSTTEIRADSIVSLTVTDAAELAFQGTANSLSEMYFDNFSAVRTTADGADVFGTLLDLNNFLAATAAGLVMHNSEGGVKIEVDGGDCTINQTNSGGAIEDVWILFNQNAAVELNYNNVRELITQPHSQDHVTSGGRTKDHAGTEIDIGFNLVPVEEFSGTPFTMTELHVAKMVHKGGGGVGTIDLPSGTSGAVPPVGAMILYTNENVAVATIAAAGTLRFFAGTGTPATGNRTLAEGGVAWMYHFADTEWWIWGFGIT